MKFPIDRWSLRWFVALWVFCGIVIGSGLGIYAAERMLGASESNFDIWLIWLGLIGYLIVSGTLGRKYLRLIRSL